LTDDWFLLARGRLPFATGVARYFDNRVLEPGSEPKILIRVAAEPEADPLLAIVDTAAPWCIFGPAARADLARNLESIAGRTALSTRLGTFQGTLYRGRITLPADEGESLEVEMTAFLSPDWPGPNFLGYQGLLQRIRFAVDPESNRFYFGPI
jgi:hypothetical protein